MKYFIEDQNTLKAMFTFDSFVEAVDFVNQVADVAIQVDHHPDILLHDYKAVTVTTTTHEADNTVTDKDKELAAKIEALME